MSVIKVGDIVEGYTVTEVRDDGRKRTIYGVEGNLPAHVIEGLRAHFAKPEKDRGFCFRPGTRIDHKINLSEEN